MGFLARFGSIVLKVAQIAIGLEPLAAAAAPQYAGQIQTVSQDLGQIASIIQEVEVIGQNLKLPGAQKLTAAAPLVAQVILQSAILANHKIQNQDQFTQGVNAIASGMADVLSSLEDKVTTVDKTA